ncbi:hypothetical protein CW306_15690 [Bacillus sp. BA3]|uniref:hypothetical protein n=1 Tax=Bacillus sp. BA3 TaxID=2057910 RepID=UPI000C338A20|nr:hypothetical protein [Bacillus sp. BA3]PKF87750.1 hypothetical protein CW306_15690 [Bacillus sp. BA3]
MKDNRVYFLILVQVEKSETPFVKKKLMEPPDSRRIGEGPVSIQYFLKKKFQLIGAGVRDSCGKKLVEGDPVGERREGSRTARGK